MGLLILRNLTPEAIPLRELYCRVAAKGAVGDVLRIKRMASDLTRMPHLAALVAEGKVGVVYEPDAGEVEGGLSSPVQVVRPWDLAPTPLTEPLGLSMDLRVDLPHTPGLGGDELEVYPRGHFPVRARVTLGWAVFSHAPEGAEVTILQEAPGACVVPLGKWQVAPGLVWMRFPENTCAVMTQAEDARVVVRRSHVAVTGELYLRLRRER